MDKKYTVQINERLYKDIQQYCSLNDLKISAFINDLLKKYFIVEKFGETPELFSKKEENPNLKNIKEEFKPIENVVQVEAIVQEPVESVEHKALTYEPKPRTEYYTTEENETIVTEENKPKKRRLK